MTTDRATSEHRLRALTIAVTAHTGQKDKAGRPYVRHPIRVAQSVQDAGGSTEAQVVAYLHDVVEDTSMTLMHLAFAGFPDIVLEAVDAISRRRGESKADYYARVKANKIALLVKKHDINDNADPKRLALLEPAERDRLLKKYAAAREALGI